MCHTLFIGSMTRPKVVSQTLIHRLRGRNHSRALHPQSVAHDNRP